MTSAYVPRVSEVISQRFVGRAEALDAFYLRFAYRHMKNGIYYYGRGGLGKTWILKKIILNSENGPTRTASEIIDFFDTQNRNIRGLQTTIKSRLQTPEAFRPYDEIIEHLDAARSQGDLIHASAIASLESRANKLFIECCQQAIVGREVILLFDTFERVQQLEVGGWLLKTFLPQVRSLIVAIAGRPVPGPARMPDNIVSYELKGLDFTETKEYIHRLSPSVTDEVIESIWECTGGFPLVIELILDLPLPVREQFVAELSRLEDGKRVQDSLDLQRGLVRQFARLDNVSLARKNRVIWAMAYLKRRFDVQMLKYVVENLGEKWLRPGDYNEVFEELNQSVYVKEYPNQQSHLLHDEVQRMVAEYVLDEATDPWKEMQHPLHDLIVNRYYPDAIKKAFEDRDLDLAHQLQAEQLGYILDDKPHTGLEQYESYRNEIENTHEYDFEELLWGEMRDHLDRFEKDRGYRICADRGEWLRRHSLFSKAEGHYCQMMDLFKEQQIEISQFAGFMAMRQGKIPEARAIFEQSLGWIDAGDYRNIGIIASDLAQAAIEAGEWDKALVYYAWSFRAASLAGDDSQKVAVYLGRGYLYSLQGLYSHAKKQCELAIQLLGSLPDNPDNARRAIYAWMNLGTANRHSDDYPGAASHYEKGLRLAQENMHRETICDSLQHLGINEHLWGRALRRKRENLVEACEHQLQAWRHLTKALEIARESDWRRAIGSGLHRLAKVYREIHRLNELPAEIKTSDFTEALQTLQQEAQTFHMPFEIEYEHELLMPRPFTDLNWLERAARLFEMSALVADDANDFHRALDGLTELARLFLELEHFNLVPLVLRRVERIKGYDYEEPLFTQVIQIIQGDWHFEQGRWPEALQQYGISYARLAKLPGYASYQLSNGLRNLEWRFSVLPHEMVLSWCDTLESAWLAESVSTVRPDMLDLLERIRLDALKKIPLSKHKH